MAEAFHFPANLERAIRDVAATSGAEPDAEALAPAVRGLSDLFVGKVPWEPDYSRDPRLRQAYLAYFLPVNLPKIQTPLAAWLSARPGWMSGRRLRCLDLGCGPGSALLGVVDFVRRLPREKRPAALDLVAVDQSRDNLRDAEALLHRLAALDPELPPIAFRAFRLDLVADRSDLLPMIVAGGRFDLIVAANLLCEILREEGGFERALDLFSSAAKEALEPEGALLLVEPGLRETARDLHRLRDRLLERGDLTVLAPCLHQAPCPALATDRDWCIADVPWKPPALVEELDRVTGLRKGSLKFAYLVLAPVAPPAIDPKVWRVVSDVLDLKGERRVYLCADGRWIVLAQLKRERSAAADAIASLRRGDLVEIEGLELRGAVFRLAERARLRRID